ncbi:uncharacterized protein [Ptychodera flava]|uniref:uncharacterized protein n=1 Tax=Ptychodera flava TaxID=63121 RepID=UPI00396A4431
MSKRCVIMLFVPFHIGIYITMSVLVAVCCCLKQFSLCFTVGLLALLLGDCTAARGIMSVKAGSTRIQCILISEVSLLALVVVLAYTVAKVSVELFLNDQMICGSAGMALFIFAILNLLFTFLVIPSLFLVLRHLRNSRVSNVQAHGTDDVKL